MLIVCRVRSYQVQHNWYHSQKLPVASKLVTIINLFPPCQSIVHTLVIGKWCPLLPVKALVRDEEVREMDNGPGGARVAIEDGEDDDPREEENEYVGCPYTWVREPLRVLVQIHRWRCPYIKIRHLYVCQVFD